MASIRRRARSRCRPAIAFKPMASMFVQLSPTIQRDEDAAQYVTTVPDSTDVAFFGNRYVFAYIKTRTISLDTRMNWTFSPNLTLQLFVQPFIASGAYTSFREFEKPRAVKKLVYGQDIGTIAADAGDAERWRIVHGGSGRRGTGGALHASADPNFTTRSLRGSAVLRWEYRPGSTVYFVWTQQRTGFDDAGDFRIRERGESAIFRDKPMNLFQIKVNYWIGR